MCMCIDVCMQTPLSTVMAHDQLPSVHQLRKVFIAFISCSHAH